MKADSDIHKYRSQNETPVQVRERVLLILGMAHRPMRWSELTNALGLSSDARTACEWLMDHGYIAPIRIPNGAVRSVEALWTLADKGLIWARANGAVDIPPARSGVSPTETISERERTQPLERTVVGRKT